MGRTPAIQLAPGVGRIPTAPADLINTFAFVDDGGRVTLVDAGVKRAPRRIVAGLEYLGSSPSEVTRIIATHAHSDHVGGLHDIHGRTGARVAVHERDAPYVRTGKGPVLDGATRLGRLPRHGLGSTPTQVFAMTKQTAHVLGEVDYEVAAFTHGPEIRDNAREVVRGFLREKVRAQ